MFLLISLSVLFGLALLLICFMTVIENRNYWDMWTKMYYEENGKLPSMKELDAYINKINANII